MGRTAESSPHIQNQPWRWLALTLPALAAALMLGVYVLRSGTVSDLDERMLPIAGALAAFAGSLVAAAVSSGARRNAWLSIAAGCIGWAGWHSAEAGASARIDLFLNLAYLSFVASLVGGMMMLVRFADGRNERVKLSLDTMPLAIALGVAIWVLSVGPIVIDADPSQRFRLSALVHGAGSVALLLVGVAGVLSRLRNGGDPASRSLLAAGTVLGIADSLWLHFSGDGGSRPLLAIDAAFVAAFGLTLAGSVAATRRRNVPEAGSHSRGARTSWESQLPDIALAGLLILTGAQALFGETVRYGIVTTVSAALAMLAFIVTRQSIVLRRDGHLRQEIGQLSAQIDGLISQVGRDPLTGLYNHRAIHERIDHELAVGRTSEEPVAVALIDVDNFKSINDTLGHQAGDRVLRAVSSILTAACRSTDVAARYAGDEFMLVLPGLDENHAGGVCTRIAQEVRRINEDLNLGKGARVSLSVGVAVTHSCQRSVAQTVAIADAAMYDAKEGGKDRVVVVNADTLEISKTHAPAQTTDALMAESRAAFWAEQDRRAG